MIKKGFINSTLERPAKFSAEPFEKVLDIFIKSRIGEAKRIKDKKNEILSDWQSIAVEQNKVESAKFSILEGKNYVYPKLRQMIESTKNQLSLLIGFVELAKLDQFGILDTPVNCLLKNQIHMRLLTEIRTEDFDRSEGILRKIPNNSIFQKKFIEENKILTPRMAIRDNEVLFFINPRKHKDNTASEEVCLWTNSDAIVESFRVLFESFWDNLSFNEKIKPIGSCRGFNVQTFATYEEFLESSKNEILITTSSKGLIELQKNQIQLRRLADRNVTVRIMAPIVSENLKAALKLKNHCEVRHTSPDIVRTIIIDGEKMARLDESSINETNHQLISGSQIPYTRNLESVKKAQGYFESTWRNSYSPSGVTIGAIFKKEKQSIKSISENARAEEGRFSGILYLKDNFPKPTESQVLHKMLAGKKFLLRNYEQEGIVNYGSRARAVIHPPAFFNLPDFMIEVIHNNKQSSFGPEDALRIYWRSDETGNRKYVLAAVVTDSRIASKARKTICPDCNDVEIQVIREDELQVRIFGNTLFAAWTIPIQFSPTLYTLPPACIMFEGYGKIRTKLNVIKTRGGQLQIYEINDYEAFVTFFHPKSKYSGPGTDGEYAREAIVTILPP